MKSFNYIRVFFGFLWMSQLLVFAMCSDANVTDNSVKKTAENTINSVDELSLKELENRIDFILNKVTKLVLPYLVRNGPTIPISGRCMSSLMKLALDAKRLKSWAIRMIDSTGKPAGGILEGTFLYTGDYDECLKISVDKRGNIPKTEDDELFRGKYCMVQVKLAKALRDIIKMNVRNEISDFSIAGKLSSLFKSIPKFQFETDELQLRWGVCIPSACSIEDFQILLNKGLQLDYFGFSANVPNCDVRKHEKVTNFQIVILTAFAIILSIAIIGTSVDVYFRFTLPDSDRDSFISQQKKPLQLLINCSIAKTTNKLLNTDENECPIGCIRGLRTIAVCGVIVMHTYYFSDENFFFNSRSVLNYANFLKEPMFAIVASLPIMVDVFFCISGYLITFVNSKRKKRTSRKLDIKGVLIRRFFRFSPFVLIAIGMFLLLPLLRNGPSFSLVMDEPLSACRRMWWANVLFINNFFAVKDHCLLHTWFVACLMQLVVLGVVFNWLVRMWPKTAITLHLLILIACNVAIGILTITVPFPPAVSLYFVEGRDMMERFTNRVYNLPFYHACSFIIGQLTGYWCSKHPEVKLKWYTVVFSWLLFVASLCGIFFYLYPYNDGQRMGNIEAFIYSAFHRVVFSLLVVWFIFACTNGYAGFLNGIFSAKLFIPLHKLSFMAYLNHGVIMYIYVGTARERTFTGHTEKILQILGYITASFLLAFFIHIIVDGPFSLVDIIIPPTSAKHVAKRSPQHKERNELTIKEVPTVTKQLELGFPKEISEVHIKDKCVTVIEHDKETFIYPL